MPELKDEDFEQLVEASNTSVPVIEGPLTMLPEPTEADLEREEDRYAQKKSKRRKISPYKSSKDPDSTSGVQ
jgi:hypothetical protein